MRTLAVLMVVVAVVGADSFVDLLREEWSAFKLKHKKSYENETEERFRKKIYAENKLKVEKHNRRFERGEVTFRLDVNKYADKLHHEFGHTMNGFNRTAKLNEEEVPLGAKFLSPANWAAPETVDWRLEGAVTEVMDQGDCNSGYAFSTTGSLEGQHFRSSGKLVSLSEQNLIDCSVKFWNRGCKGGHVGYALLYILNSGGLNTEESYPYEGVDNTCRFCDCPTSVVVGLEVYTMMTDGNEEIMKETVAAVGPLSAMIDASQLSFLLYSSGVYYDEGCSSKNLNHGVLVVGYGTDEEGGDYWLVRNSWGTWWGENGYIKMARNRGNNCGIASYVAYPFV
ncbi:cathepsin L-like isoform X4 [Vanessa cardui]|uniref:cathepsin L-like isoform X4 n=1 Tax=Vanessa cardui TaxID=171605 RepID=UPI001F12A607|nr:cathepsin L-like isoform X4 [Vanessa cardui]